MRSADPNAARAPGRLVPRPIVEAHVEAVLSSIVFRTADRLRDLLRFAVHETLEGRGDDLKEYVLGATALGKGDSFDPKTDPIVRVQMRRLREHLHLYYSTEGRSDPVVIEISKGRYVPTFRAATCEDASPAPEIMAERFVVGRRTELTALRAAFDSAASGHGGLLLVAGEPGIGKTTVVEALLNDLAASDVRCSVARGRCSERLAGNEAYLPLLEALDSLIRSGESSARLMSVVAPTWYAQVTPFIETVFADRVDDESRIASQARMKRELLALFEEFARRQPLVVFLDDLQWADASTIDLLSYVATRCDSHRILIVGAYRPSDVPATDHPFVRSKLELQAHGRCRELSLPFLIEADVQRFLDLQFPGHHFPPDVSTRIHHWTEGNPLFMADLVRFLRDRGAFTRRDGRWMLTEPLASVEPQLPESIRSLIEKKIGQLTEADRRVLTMAAVQGQEFDSAVVARALNRSPADIDERLDVLERTHELVRLVASRELPDSTLTLRYRFVHVLYQSALHSALTATRKASLSVVLAHALLAFHQDQRDEVASELALLFEAGRDFAQASDCFLLASQHAARVYAACEASSLARRALANAEKLQGRERSSRVMVAALHSAAQHESLGRLPEAIADLTLAEVAAAELGEPDAQVNAIFRKALVLLTAKRLSEMREQGTRAMELAEAVGSREAIASSRVILALERCCTGEVMLAEEQFDHAIPVLRERDPFNHALWAVLMRGVLHSYHLEHDQADVALEWASERARALRARFYLVLARFHQARTRGNQGRFFDARIMLEEALRLAELHDDRVWLPRIANTRGWLLSELFDNEAALRLSTDAIRMAREFGDVETEQMSLVSVAHDYLALGEPERAWEHLQQAESRHAQDAWFRWVYYPRLQAEIARYWIVRGDLGQADSCARASLAHAERTLNRKRMSWAHKLLGEIAALQDRPEDARQEFEMACEILRHHACPPIEWQILRAAAAAANARGDEAARSALTSRAREIVTTLADFVRDNALRRRFLGAEPVRQLFS